MFNQICVYCQSIIDNDKNMCLNCGTAQPEKALAHNEKPAVIAAKEKEDSAPVLKTVSITCLVLILIPVVAFGCLWLYLYTHPEIHL